MVDAEKLLESLTDDEVIDILLDLGAEKYKRSKSYISFDTSLCHGGSNLNLVYNKAKKYLRCFSGCGKSYSIFDLVQKVKSCSFVKALDYVARFVHRQYDREQIDEKDRITDWVWIKKLRRKNRDTAINESTVLDKRILNQYISVPHDKWCDDGIMPETQREWGVMFDIKTERICYGIYTEDDQLIGVKGRAVDDEVEPRYLYLYPCVKSEILLGLNKNLSSILEHKKCIVFESFKSVMLASQYGYNYCVSVEGGSISEWQLKKLLLMDVDIILAFDKGIEKTEENKDFYKKIIERISSYSDLSIIFDNDNILDGEKSSVVDEGIEKFKLLYENRYKINHLQYNT